MKISPESREKILYMALDKYCHDTIKYLPLNWRVGAIKKMAIERQDEPTERLKDLINFVIDETEKRGE